MTKSIIAGSPSDLFPQTFLQNYITAGTTPWKWDATTTIGGSTSATISSGICTLNTTSAHNMVPGQSFYLSGLTPATGSLTGYFVAITASGSAVTFATTATGAVTGTGAVVVPDIRVALLTSALASAGSGNLVTADYQGGSGVYGVATGVTNNSPTGGVGGTGAGSLLLGAVEVTPGGGGSGYYNAGGKAITTPTITNSGGVLSFGADNCAWPPTGVTPDATNYATMSSVWAALLFAFSSTAKLAVGLVNFGQAYVVSGGQLTVVWSPTGTPYAINMTPN